MVKLILLPGTLSSCRARYNFGGRARRARSEEILISGLVIKYNYCAEWDIKLNPKKTKNLYFGKGPVPRSKLILNGAAIDWVDKWNYLGVTLVHGPNFGCCINETLSKFYRAANAILRVDGKSDDIVMLRLLESHCLSILSYAIEVVHVTDKRQKSKMRVAYNSMFRKIFNYSWRESVTELQHALGRPTWEELIANRIANFTDRFRYLPADSLVRSFSQ